MSWVIRESRPVAQKTHRCGWCTTKIVPGTRYRRQVLIGDDGLYDWVCCAACEPLVTPAYDWYGDGWADGITEDEMYEWARKHQDDATWGAQATAFLMRWNRGAGW